jgi:hypothetical protein
VGSTTRRLWHPRAVSPRPQRRAQGSSPGPIWGLALQRPFYCRRSASVMPGRAAMLRRGEHGKCRRRRPARPDHAAVQHDAAGARQPPRTSRRARLVATGRGCSDVHTHGEIHTGSLRGRPTPDHQESSIQRPTEREGAMGSLVERRDKGLGRRRRAAWPVGVSISVPVGPRGRALPTGLWGQG